LDQSHVRLDIPAAAARLGLTEAAVRKRVQRRQLASVRVDGHVYVVLDESNGAVHPETEHVDVGQAQSHVASHDGPTVVTLAAQLERADAEIAFLRSELERRDQALGQAHAIIMRFAEQRALPPASSAPATDVQEPAHPHHEPAAGAAPRPWWRFWRR
jgi:hypothetical protein